MIAVAFACLPIFYSGKRIERWEGILFLFYYVAYTAYLILDSVDHAILPLFINIMLVIIALTAIALITIAIMEKRAKNQKTI
jgi:cation:H+ antiporter